MKPGLRKIILTVHVITSVWWCGAVAGFLVLAIAGLLTKSGGIERAAYVAMDLTIWYAIVPLCFGSVLSGITASLGTEWGFVRHYWLLVKLLLTVPSTLLLMLHPGWTPMFPMPY